MNIEPIAYYHGPMTTKFGLPRQSGLAPDLPGTIVFEPRFRQPEAVRGLEGFSHLWLVWGFSANRHTGGSSLSNCRAVDSPENESMQTESLTVRPPRLGGNSRVGVFASRSPFRPNGLGLSCVRINKVEATPSQGMVIHVLGADLMDGTPVYDVKPYVAYTDCHPDARCGFVDEQGWQLLTVKLSTELSSRYSTDEQALAGLRQVLEQDPRPRYHNDPDRVYGIMYDGCDVRFRVSDGVLTVTDIIPLKHHLT